MSTKKFPGYQPYFDDNLLFELKEPRVYHRGKNTIFDFGGLPAQEIIDELLSLDGKYVPKEDQWRVPNWDYNIDRIKSLKDRLNSGPALLVRATTPGLLEHYYQVATEETLVNNPKGENALVRVLDDDRDGGTGLRLSLCKYMYEPAVLRAKIANGLVGLYTLKSSYRPKSRGAALTNNQPAIAPNKEKLRLRALAELELMQMEAEARLRMAELEGLPDSRALYKRSQYLEKRGEYKRRHFAQYGNLVWVHMPNGQVLGPFRSREEAEQKTSVKPKFIIKLSDSIFDFDELTHEGTEAGALKKALKVGKEFGARILLIQREMGYGVREDVARYRINGKTAERL